MDLCTCFVYVLVLGLAALCSSVQGQRDRAKMVNVSSYMPNDVIVFNKTEDGQMGFYRFIRVLGDKMFIGARNVLYTQKMSDISDQYLEPLQIESKEFMYAGYDTSQIIERKHRCYKTLVVSAELDCENWVTDMEYFEKNNSFLICNANARLPYFKIYEINEARKNWTDVDDDYYFGGHFYWPRCPKFPMPWEYGYCRTFDVNDTLMPNVTSLTFCINDFDIYPSAVVKPFVSGLRRLPVDIYPQKNEQFLTSYNRKFISNRSNKIRPGQMLYNALYEVGHYVMTFLHMDDFVSVETKRPFFSRAPYAFKVCKNDLGFPKSGMAYEHYRNFATSIHTQLECKAQGMAGIRLNKMWDIQRDGDLVQILFSIENDDFYKGVATSGVCMYNLTEISDVMNTEYMNTEDGEKLGQKMEWNEYNDVRKNCKNNTLEDYDVNDYTWLGKHHETYQHVHSTALLTVPGVTYTKMTAPLAVGDYNIYFLASAEGEIHKIVQYTVMKNDKIKDMRSHILARWTPFAQQGYVYTVWSMHLKDNFIYASTDASVVQFPVEQCKKYKTCMECVIDPHCGWSTVATQCQKHAVGLLQDVTAQDNGFGTCTQSVPYPADTKTIKTTVGEGSYFLLKSPNPIYCRRTNNTVWEFNDNLLRTDGDHYHYTMQRDLLVTKVKPEDAGVYKFVCINDRFVKNEITQLHPGMRFTTLRTYNVTTANCAFSTATEYQAQYTEWCDAFDSYKEEMKAWKQRYEASNCRKP